MLVLSRKLGEEIVIGDNIRVMLVAVNGNRVKLGVSAPEATRIMRSEVAGLSPAQASAGGSNPSGYEPVRGDVPADALLPSRQNIQSPETD